MLCDISRSACGKIEKNIHNLKGKTEKCPPSPGASFIRNLVAEVKHKKSYSKTKIVFPELYLYISESFQGMVRLLETVV